MGAGERRKVEPEALFSIPYSCVPISGKPYDWSILTVYVNTYVNHLALRAPSQTNMRTCETLLFKNMLACVAASPRIV